MKKVVLHLIMLLFGQYIIANEVNAHGFDSLSSKSCTYLSRAFKTAMKDSVRSVIYAEAWLSKAKKTNDLSQLSEAYKALMYSGDKSKQFYYADKMIETAKKTADDAIIGSAYLSRGAVYYNLENHNLALDNYIKADEYISRTRDQYLIHKVKYAIALTKMYLGFYDESLGILKECEAFYKDDNERAYLASLHALGICYTRLGKIQLSTGVNLNGIQIANEVGDAKMRNHFIHSEGINCYFRKEYKTAIAKLTQTLQNLDEKNDKVAATAANFYIAKSYWALGQFDTALKFLEKVDDAFIKQGYTRPELREAFEMLINYYKSKNDEKLVSLRIERLLEVDKVLTPNYKYLSSRIHKQYDTNALLRSKEKLEVVVDEMSEEKRVGIYIIAGLSVTVIVAVAMNIRNRKKYKHKFEEWRNRSEETVEVIGLQVAEKDSELDINPELEAIVMKNLEKFEAHHRYTEKDMTLIRMATILQANPKYVSKIIQRRRGKKFTQYMNEIKISYIIQMLEKESRWRNYTNQALAREAGFGSTQNFTRAFNTKMGMPPTFFIQQLKKEISARDLN